MARYKKNEVEGNRRAFLRRAVTSTALGIVGVETIAERVAGSHANVDDEALAQAQQVYESPKQVQQALQKQGAELLGILSREGIMPTPVVEALPINSVHTPEQFGGRDEGTIVTAKAPDGVPSAHITIAKTIDDSNVIITLLPQAGKAYARVKTEEETKIYDPDADDDEVNIETCMSGLTCARCNCSHLGCGCCTWEVICCSDECYFDTITRNFCDDCYDVCWAYCEDLCYEDDGCD